ncbi:MAG TPA: hypothetical protein VHQ02_03185 [Usitatibacter sp.]|nr:hypothetical protein [Usitatibacter sp.]
MRRAALAWVLVSLALACRAADNPLARFTTLSAPDCAGASNIIAEDADAPPNVTYIRVQHIGDPGTAELAGEVANPVTWDVGEVSGLHPRTPALSQRGYRDVGLPEGTSAFQLECGAAGFLINSWQFSHASPLFGEGPSASIARDLSPAPRAYPGPGWTLRIGGDVSVPWSLAQVAPVDAGTAQVSFFYYVQDATSGVVFAHLAGLFDNRPGGVGGSGVESVGSDGVTAFVSSPLLATDAAGSPVQYLRPGVGSATMQLGATWPDRRAFRAEVPYASFRAMLQRLKSGPLPQISDRPEDYRVLFFGVLGEVFPETGDAHNISLAASVTSLALTQEPPRPMPAR